MKARKASASTKSGSASRRQRRKVGLNKIISRDVYFRVIEEDDLKYLWAAYKKGDLKRQDMPVDDDLTPEAFKLAIIEYMSINVLDAVVFFANVDGEVKPVGLCLYWPRGRVLQIENLIWFSWASPRNVFESAAYFLDKTRKTKHPESGRNYVVMEFARKKHKRYFERMMDAGIMTRVGSVPGLYPKEDATMFITKELK